MWSLPLRKCGLKSCICWPISVPSCHFPCGSVDWNMAFCASSDLTNRSLPLRKCGLKSEAVLKVAGYKESLPLRKCGLKFVAMSLYYMTKSSLPLRKCGLKSLILCTFRACSRSLPLRKCGLKCWSAAWSVSLLRHFPCGSVDWNTVLPSMATMQEVTSLAEVWIEICNENPLILVTRGHFPCGSVDWNHGRLPESTASRSHFPCGSVDWNVLLRLLCMG